MRKTGIFVILFLLLTANFAMAKKPTPTPPPPPPPAPTAIPNDVLQHVILYLEGYVHNRFCDTGGIGPGITQDGDGLIRAQDNVAKIQSGTMLVDGSWIYLTFTTQSSEAPHEGEVFFSYQAEMTRDAKDMVAVQMGEYKYEQTNVGTILNPEYKLTPVLQLGSECF